MRATIEGIISRLATDASDISLSGETDLAVEANNVLTMCWDAIGAAREGLDEVPTEDSVLEMFSEVRNELESYRQAKDEVEHAFHRLTAVMDNVQSAAEDLDLGGSWDLYVVSGYLDDAQRHTETLRKSVEDGVVGGFSVPPKELLDRTARKAAGIVCSHLIEFLSGLQGRLNDE